MSKTKLPHKKPDFPAPLKLAIFESLDRLTKDARTSASDTLDYGIDIFQTSLGIVEIFKFRVKGDQGWSYQIGQGLYPGELISIEAPVKTGYKYDLSWPELVNLSKVNTVYRWDELVNAVENGKRITEQYNFAIP